MLFTICLLPLEDQFLEIVTLFHSFSSSLHVGWHSGTSLSSQRNEIKRNRGKKAEGAKVRAFKNLARGHPNGHMDSTSGPCHMGSHRPGGAESLPHLHDSPHPPPSLLSSPPEHSFWF